MLSDEDRMPSHRCLFAIIFWKRGRYPGIYKLIGVLFDGFKTFGGDVIPVFSGELELGSEFGFFKSGELFRYI